MGIQIGDKAPDFKAEAHYRGTTREIQLSHYRGQWVLLLFYPADFTFVWPTEMAAVAVKYPAFRELGAEVLTVSVDSVITHKEWHEKELSRMVEGGALFPMISDPEGKIGTLFGVYDTKAGLDLRSHFLIDPQGVVQAMEVLAAPIGRNIAEILRQLRALQHHQATGEFMPCGWEPGKPTLTEGDEASSAAGKVWNTWKPRNAF